MPPVVFSDELWGIEYIDGEHSEVLEGASGCFGIPAFVFAGVACAEVVEGAFTAPVVSLPQQSAEEGGGFEISFDAEQIEKSDKSAQGDIEQPIEQGIVFLSLFLCSFVGCGFGHRM